MSQDHFEKSRRALRSVGIDDGPFELQHRALRRRAPLVAVFFDGLALQAIKAGSVLVDGLDATGVVCELLMRHRFDLILLSGVTFAGFNVVDPWRIYGKFKKPVLVVTGDRPRNRAVKSALRLHFPDWERRWAIFKRLPKVHRVKTKSDEPPLHFEAVGLAPLQARTMMKRLSANSRLPEPIRVAGIVARGIGQTTGLRGTIRGNWSW